MGSNRRKAKRVGRPTRLGSVLVVALIALVGCSEPPFVDRVTIVNGTDYPANVDVTSGAHEAWLGLGVAGPNEDETFGEVIDHGQLWVFRFDYAAKHSEEIRVTRKELKEANWRVEVPFSFEQRLRQLGVEPPP